MYLVGEFMTEIVAVNTFHLGYFFPVVTWMNLYQFFLKKELTVLVQKSALLAVTEEEYEPIPYIFVYSKN